jgi:hypothetical protein
VIEAQPIERRSLMPEDNVQEMPIAFSRAIPEAIATRTVRAALRGLGAALIGPITRGWV